HGALRHSAHRRMARPVGRDGVRPGDEDHPAAPDLHGRGRARLRADDGTRMSGMRWARAALPVLVASQLLPAAGASPRAGAARFDSSRAFEHIRQLVAIGPRPAGSPGNEQARVYIAAQLKALGLSPTLQQFSADTPLGTTKMANVLVKIPGADAGRILITGHFDTKLFRQFRFVGANDGGSSAAMLLELARVLKARKNAYTIDLVFFDGEEAVLPEWGGTDHTYGSRHYVDTAKRDGSIASIKAMILFDMIGDRNLTIRKE